MNKYYEEYRDTKLRHYLDNEEKFEVSILPLMKLLVFIKVGIDRIKQGHLLEVDHELESVLNSEMYQYMEKYFNVIEEYHFITLPKVEKVHIFYVCVYTEFYFLYTENEKVKILTSIREDNSKLLVSKLIKHLNQEFELNLFKNDEFLLSIYDFFRRLDLQSLYSGIRKVGSRDSTKHLEKRFPESFDKVEKVGKCFCKENNIQSFTKDTIATIVNLIEIFKLKEMKKKQVVFVYSEVFHLKKLAIEIIERDLGNIINIISIPLTQIKYVDMDQYDLIISDSQLNINNDKIVLINKIPNKKDLELIRSNL